MKIAHTARRTLDAVQLLLGAGLVASPWFAGYLDERIAAYSAWSAGAAAALVALVALLAQRRWLPWVMGLVGLWTVVAPWALAFQSVPSAVGSHVGFGLALLAAAAADLIVAFAEPKTKQTA
jgi:hypothetical protein